MYLMIEKEIRCGISTIVNREVEKHFEKVRGM
jgi:hypothetical protein